MCIILDSYQLIILIKKTRMKISTRTKTKTEQEQEQKQEQNDNNSFQLMMQRTSHVSPEQLVQQIPICFGSQATWSKLDLGQPGGQSSLSFIDMCCVEMPNDRLPKRLLFGAGKPFRHSIIRHLNTTLCLWSWGSRLSCLLLSKAKEQTIHAGHTASLTSLYVIVRWLSKTADKQAENASKSAMRPLLAQIQVQAHAGSKQGVSMHYALCRTSHKQAVSKASCKLSPKQAQCIAQSSCACLHPPAHAASPSMT